MTTQKVLELIMLLIAASQGENVYLQEKHLIAKQGNTVRIDCPIPTEYCSTKVNWYQIGRWENKVISIQESFSGNTIDGTPHLVFLNNDFHGQKQEFGCSTADMQNQVVFLTKFVVLTIGNYTAPTILYKGYLEDGQIVNFTCSTMATEGEFGSQTPFFDWEANVYVISSYANRNRNTIINSFLVKLTAEHHQKYVTCLLFDPVFKPLPMASRMVLNVLYPPKVKIRPTKVITDVGEQIHMICEANGNPFPKKFAWWRNGVLISNRDYISISFASAKDSGEYLCQVENAVGSGSSNATVTVVSRIETKWTEPSPRSGNISVNSPAPKFENSSSRKRTSTFEDMLTSWKFWILCFILIAICFISAVVAENCRRQIVANAEETESI